MPDKDAYLYPNKNYFKYFDINGNLKERIKESDNTYFQVLNDQFVCILKKMQKVLDFSFNLLYHLIID